MIDRNLYRWSETEHFAVIRYAGSTHRRPDRDLVMGSGLDPVTPYSKHFQADPTVLVNSQSIVQRWGEVTSRSTERQTNGAKQRSSDFRARQGRCLVRVDLERDVDEALKRFGTFVEQ